MVENYGINDIQSLSFKEGVRTRIQMYLGSDDLEGTYQALKEIINNSTDEALAGFGNKIEIYVSEKENYVAVRDYGRGVPFGIREDGENVLISIYSKSHTGGKFSEGAYKNSSGLNGIGAKCVCLSSEKFEVQSNRDGKWASAYFEKGELVSYREGESKNPNGTYVRFKPDPEVFKNGKIGYSYNRICNDIKNISYLYTNVTFIVINDDTKETATYCAKNGIIDFVKDNIDKPLHSHIIYDSIEMDGDKLEIAFQWGSKHEESYVFVNGLQCPEGGSPITGAKTAITRTFNSLSKQNFNGDSIRNNLFYVINCSVRNPSFANQTKTKINNANLRTMASNCFSNALKQMNFKYKNEFDSIVELLRKIEKAEAAAERARKQVLDAVKDTENEKKKRIELADKLKDCKNHGSESGSVLAICEGDSALGALVQARPIDSVALMPIRGKIISALKHEPEKILKNEEVKAIFSALGCGFFERYNSKKLRYQYVAIAADQDPDGKNIGCLLITLFYYMCPELIKEGRLLWMQMPLHVLTYKDKVLYAFSDFEKNEIIKKYGKPKEIGRKKGIGENTPEETKEAVFGPQKRWWQLCPKNNEDFSNLIQMLMGKDVEERKDFIMKNVDFSLIGE